MIYIQIMLNICGSNFVPIIITLICCAGLFMYFNLRLAEIKVAVEKQNRVLTAFITNVQEDIRSGGTAFACASQGTVGGAGASAGTSHDVGMNHMAAPEAIIAAQKFEHDKIVVSDDEDSDSESDSDEESDEESDDEGECEAVVPTKPNITMHDLNVEQIIPLSFEVLPVVVDLSGATETAFDLSITEISDGALNVLGDSERVSSEAVHVGEAVHDEAVYGDMKVDELRKIVSDKSLATKEEVKKLKKPELLLLLKK